MEKFDAIIIGSGQAGNPLAICAGSGELMSLLQVAVMGVLNMSNCAIPCSSIPPMPKPLIINLFSPIHLKPGGSS